MRWEHGRHAANGCWVEARDPRTWPAPQRTASFNIILVFPVNCSPPAVAGIQKYLIYKPRFVSEQAAHLPSTTKIRTPFRQNELKTRGSSCHVWTLQIFWSWVNVNEEKWEINVRMRTASKIHKIIIIVTNWHQFFLTVCQLIENDV